MSQTLAAATQRRASSAASGQPSRSAPRAPRPALRVVHAPAVDRGRTAFVIGCMLLLVGGLLGLLLINTALGQGSFTLHDLQQRSDELGDRQQALRQDIDAQAAPERLAARAKALGMVASQGAAFIRLPDGRLLGVAERATPAPTPTVKVTPSTAAPTSKPTGTAPKPASGQHATATAGAKKTR
jgi:hypothetical protein